MAGAGYKLFQTGDVLTAAQVNTYLNEQTVMVFANAAARTSALTSVLAEGMVSYLQDTNAVEVYNGSAWVGVSGAGDVTEVQAGVGISVASGTGPIPIITNSSTDLITTAGDLLYGTAADTVARLGIGTAGQVLKVNSGATAPEWGAAAAPSQGWTLLNAGGTALTGATTITVSGISDKADLLILFRLASSANASSYMSVNLNGDTGANYPYAGANILAAANPGNISDASATGETTIFVGRMGNTVGARVSGTVRVTGCKATTNNKAWIATGSGDSVANAQGFITQGLYTGTSAITSVSITSSTGNFDAGTIFVYGSDN